MYNDDERQIIRDILGKKKVLDLLHKALLTDHNQLPPEVVLNKNNEELGEWVRANILAEDKLAVRLARLLSIANRQTGGKPKVVPK